ncbi:hypothetical protein GCM10028862_18540 [Luteimonas pelagia]
MAQRRHARRPRTEGPREWMQFMPDAPEPASPGPPRYDSVRMDIFGDTGWAPDESVQVRAWHAERRVAPRG